VVTARTCHKKPASSLRVEAYVQALKNNHVRYLLTQLQEDLQKHQLKHQLQYSTEYSREKPTEAIVELHT